MMNVKVKIYDEIKYLPMSKRLQKLNIITLKVGTSSATL